MRLYRAWYRHITLSMAALAYLTAVRAEESVKRGTTDGGDELISSNAGKTWHQVSGTRTAVVGSTASSYAPMTAWYADGAKLLARACVREHFGHTDTKQACTAAH